MKNRFLGRAARKSNYGRRMRIESWDRLELVIELIKTSLPIDVTLDLNRVELLRSPSPFPYDLRMESSITIPTTVPLLAEVRVSLCVDETVARLASVYFCIDQWLTALEVVTKLADAYKFLKAWTHVHTYQQAEHNRIGRTQARRPSNSRKNLIQ